MDYKLHMKFIGDDDDGCVQGVLYKPDGSPCEHDWEAPTYAEVIHDVFYELGHKITRQGNKLTITFEN